MASAGEDIIGGCCGFCCIAIAGALSSWFNMKPYGSKSGSSSSGCCGCCCRKSFDEDAFEEEVRRDMEKTRDPNAPRLQHPTNQQPSQGNAMASHSVPS
ncbi:hypothetical protein CPB83DRAFT_850474 [Crepidotus variabilis]|uniref:Uncharacterized protein n=1 Tax=Crepidotus variabilis TaxID=179855 RepID=A0A9P6EK54_9AGAR|nr:hypothetical protein CPB83DRAFT_850474 [Crepidotus variabilis]